MKYLDYSKLPSFIERYYPNTADPEITIQPTNYDLQAGTCLALDLPHALFEDYGGTLRDYYRHDCRTLTVTNNRLPICLGVSGCLICEDDRRSYLLQVKRAEHLASMAGTFGPSVAGGVDYRTDYNTLADIIAISMKEEIGEETGLRPDEYQLTPLAWAMELFRGERPQLFSLIRTQLSRFELSARLDAIPIVKREFSAFDFIPLDDRFALADDDIARMNYEAKVNWYLAEEWLHRGSKRR